MTREDELVEAVLADPDSDAPRIVLGDYWQDLGDPRGELVALQLKPRTEARDARIAEIVKADTWLGLDLRRVTKQRAYRRGLLDSFALLGTDKLDLAGWRRAALDPALATVRRVDRGVGHEEKWALFQSSPAMRSLTEATARPKMFQTVRAGATAKQLTSLALYMRLTAETLAEVAASFPALRSLTVVCYPEDLPVLATTIGAWRGRKRLEAIGVRTRFAANKRPIVKWLRAQKVFGVPAVFAENDGLEDTRLTLRAGPDLEVTMTANAEIMDLIALFGSLRRLEIKSDGHIGMSGDINPYRRALQKLAPEELVLPERWRPFLGTL